MTTAKFRRPDGRDGTYGQWAAEIAARWSALSATEQQASREAANTRLKAQIRAQADDEPTLMHLYDEIGWFGVWPADVVEALNGIKGSVEVHLNSPGGNVFDGLAIYAALKAHPGPVGVVVDGLAASAASFIAMAASPGKLAMTPNGTMMIHNAWGMCMGDATEMTEMAALLDRTDANIASIYAERGGLTAGEYRDLMKAETWAVGQEAVDLRLADTVRTPAADAPAAPVVTSAWQVTFMTSAAGEPWDPDGDGDDDSTPEGDTDHDYWAEDGTQLKPVPGKPMRDAQGQLRDHRGRLVNAAADESDWDASKAWAAGAASDDPEAFYNAICAGRKAGDPATQAAHALPHHYHPGDPPNRHGVSAALGRIDATDGLTNKQAAEAHLKAHQSAMGSGADNHAGGLPAWLRDDA